MVYHGGRPDAVNVTVAPFDALAAAFASGSHDAFSSIVVVPGLCLHEIVGAGGLVVVVFLEVVDFLEVVVFLTVVLGGAAVVRGDVVLGGAGWLVTTTTGGFVTYTVPGSLGRVVVVVADVLVVLVFLVGLVFVVLVDVDLLVEIALPPSDVVTPALEPGSVDEVSGALDDGDVVIGSPPARPPADAPVDDAEVDGLLEATGIPDLLDTAAICCLSWLPASCWARSCSPAIVRR